MATYTIYHIVYKLNLTALQNNEITTARIINILSDQLLSNIQNVNRLEESK